MWRTFNDEDTRYPPLAQSAVTARVNAPADRRDIATWLLSIPGAEYQRCATGDHISAGDITTDDGRPMSINVEQVGDALLIEHYVGEITDKLHRKMMSLELIDKAALTFEQASAAHKVASMAHTKLEPPSSPRG